MCWLLWLHWQSVLYIECLVKCLTLATALLWLPLYIDFSVFENIRHDIIIVITLLFINSESEVFLELSSVDTLNVAVTFLGPLYVTNFVLSEVKFNEKKV